LYNQPRITSYGTYQKEEKMRLTPPKKTVFWTSVAIAVIAFLLYVLNLLGVLPEGYAGWLDHLLFWLPTVSFVLLALGNALKGF
jgi:hypothetical protein